jgi:hypothetical protein
VPLERSLDIRSRKLERNIGVRVTLRNPLVENVRDAEKLILACFPHANEYRTWDDTTTFARRSFLRGLCEVLLNSLKQRIDMLPYIFGIVLFHDLLQRGPVVAAIVRYLSWCRRFQQSFDAVKIFLKGRRRLTIIPCEIVIENH